MIIAAVISSFTALSFAEFTAWRACLRVRLLVLISLTAQSLFFWQEMFKP
jgi:hypothetical protein